MSVNERALRAALDSMAAALDGLYALLPDEDEPPAAALTPPAGVRPCKHARREPIGGFGGVVPGWYCNDCGAEWTGTGTAA